MLVLTRKPGESLIVAGNITITVVQVQGTRVRLGIQAPPEIAIHRQELLERLANEAAAPQEPQTAGH